MNLVHMVATRLLPGATVGAVPTPAPATAVIGRRRRTRTYKTPAPYAIEQEYSALVEKAPAEVIRPLIGPYILRGDLPLNRPPPVQAVDWEALAHDAEAVVKLFDAYLEYVDDEEVTVLLLGEY